MSGLPQSTGTRAWSSADFVPYIQAPDPIRVRARIKIRGNVTDIQIRAIETQLASTIPSRSFHMH